jgi:Phosphotransferase enzyme family
MTECRDRPAEAVTSATLDTLESQAAVNPADTVRPTGSLYPRTPRYQPDPLDPADPLYPAPQIRPRAPTNPVSPVSPVVFTAPTSDEDPEIPLLGGDMTEGVVRVGRTVRRPARPHTPAVHALLRHLEAVGFEGAPRVLGIDAQNREVLSYLPGQVPHRPLPGYALSEATLVALAELQLRYHEAVTGFEPPSGARWDGELTWRVDGPVELICHCDINLENVIFRPGPDGPQPYALIDFDLARPGTRLVDIIQTLRYWAPLAAPADRDPAFAGLDVPARIAVFCEAYGLSYAERVRLVPVAVRWLRRSRTTITERAERGGEAWARMLDAGVGERLVRAAGWLERCRPEIEARLRRGGI